MGLIFRPRSELMRLAGADCTTAIERLAHLHRSGALTSEECADAFTDLRIVANVGATAERGYVEWVVTGVHTGTLVVDDEVVIPPTGNQVTVRGVTLAEFSGDRISGYRQYWDEPTLLAGLGLIPAG